MATSPSGACGGKAGACEGGTGAVLVSKQCLRLTQVELQVTGALSSGMSLGGTNRRTGSLWSFVEISLSEKNK